MLIDWGNAAIIAAMVGQVFGILARVIPAIPNKLVPIIMAAVSFLVNIKLVVDKFLEAAGIQTALDSLDPVVDAHLAGFGLGGLKWLAKVIVAGLLALGYIPVQRLVYEKGIKPFMQKQPGVL